MAAAKKLTAQAANLNFNTAVSQMPGNIFAPVCAQSYTAMYTEAVELGEVRHSLPLRIFRVDVGRP